MGLSWYETLTFPLVVGLVLGKGLYATVAGPFRDKEQAKTLGDHVVRKITNGALSTLSARQIQAVAPTFESTYRSYCKSKNLEPDVVDVIPGTSIPGFWIGDKLNATALMVYYHGGGFVTPGLPPHVETLARWVAWSDQKLAVFCPCYSLAPDAIYPQALGECVEALRFVQGMTKNKKKKADLLLGGDSAGGNLVIAVLSHVSGRSHPNAKMVRPLELERPLIGALLISPWVSSDDRKFPSMRTLSQMDVLNTACAQYWIGLYKGPAGKDDEYVVPETASVDWWRGWKDTVVHLLVCAGANEVFRDSIKSWEAKLEQAVGSPKIRLVVADGEVHDEPLSGKRTEKDFDQEGNGNESQEGAIYRWIKKTIA